jgi:hypothetical protein
MFPPEKQSVHKSLNRSRSPLPRIRHLLSLRVPSAPCPRSEPSIPSFPIDVILEIGRHLSSRPDVLSFSLLVFRTVVLNQSVVDPSLSVQASTVGVDVQVVRHGGAQSQ